MRTCDTGTGMRLACVARLAAVALVATTSLACGGQGSAYSQRGGTNLVEVQSALPPGHPSLPPSHPALPPSHPPLPPAQSAEKNQSDPYFGSVVRVQTKIVGDARTGATLGSERSGSGVILDSRTVLTIGYLIVEAEEVEIVTTSGRRLPANVAGYDHETGFGLVRTIVPLDGKSLELGDSDRIDEKQRVFTLGYGEDESTELRVVSRKPFAGSWEYLLERPIFTFPPVRNWSGAALIDEGGKLVGIGSLIVKDAAAGNPGIPGNLFVPVNLLKPILEEMLRSGKREGPAHPWLGVTTEAVHGHLIVVQVTPGGPAEKAGLSSGDIILDVAGTKVADAAEFYRSLWKVGPAGIDVPLRVLMSGDVREVRVQSMDRAEFLRKPRGI